MPGCTPSPATSKRLCDRASWSTSRACPGPWTGRDRNGSRWLSRGNWRARQPTGCSSWGPTAPTSPMFRSSSTISKGVRGSLPDGAAGGGTRPATGDVLLSAELMLDDPGWQAGVLAHKAAGGHYIQIVHDILPLQLPEFFIRGLDMAFERWLGFVTRTADLVVCDSRATMDAVEAWRRVTPGQAGPAPTEWFRLGCDFGLVSPHGPLMQRRRGRTEGACGRHHRASQGDRGRHGCGSAT